MANPRTFGRRAAAQPQSLRMQKPMPSAPDARFAPTPKLESLPPMDAATPAIDDELERWKKARRFQIPWRPLSLMASLCFGIASFALPDSVNDSVQWLLYGLMAASFYVGIKKRRAKATGTP